MEPLDKIDRKLLYQLEQDARQPLSSIAKKLRTSQQVVSYRLQQLENKEIIGGFYTIINFGKLGYSSYRTMLKLSNLNERSYKELIQYFIQHKNVLWSVECGGKWDLIINLLAKNPVQYNKFLIEIKKQFKEIILDYDLLLTIEGIHFSKDYLLTEEKKIRQGPYPYFGREVNIEPLDTIDKKLLSRIAENARMTAAELSINLNISSNTIIARIKELKKKSIIQGFKPLIHLENMGYQGYKSLIKLNPLREEKEKELINQLSMNKNIVGILKMVGQWDFEIEFELQSREEMLKLTREVRTKFKSIIKEFETIPLFHEYKYSFYPGE